MNLFSKEVEHSASLEKKVDNSRPREHPALWMPLAPFIMAISDRKKVEGEVAKEACRIPGSGRGLHYE